MDKGKGRARDADSGSANLDVIRPAHQQHRPLPLKAHTISATASTHDQGPNHMSSDGLDTGLNQPGILPKHSAAAQQIREAQAQAALTSGDKHRPSLLNRVTDTLAQALSRPSGSADKPLAPTHWTSSTHVDTILKIWDTAYARTAGAKKLKASDMLTKDMVASVRMKTMSLHPELSKGTSTLTAEWIEHVLVRNLRAPLYQSASSKSRWEVLATASTAGGFRGGWGPW